MEGMEKVGKLLDAWRANGRAGLTLQFLAAATAMSPGDILEGMQNSEMYNYYVSYCGDVRAPVFNRTVKFTTDDHINYINLGQLYLYWNLKNVNLQSVDAICQNAKEAIAIGKPSRRYDPVLYDEVPVMCDMPFSESELQWVAQVLGA